MNCDRIQARISRAIDEDRGLSGFEPHLAACMDCRDFAAVAVDVAERYRRRVERGVERLRRSTPPAAVPRAAARGWIAAAAALILLSVPLRQAPEAPPAAPAAASVRVPLFDAPAPDPVDLGVLAWSGESPLPRRLDQDLSGAAFFEADPAAALPPGLRF